MASPVVLNVPGLNNSGPDHWQTLWEEQRDDCVRIDLLNWDLPARNLWVSRIEQAVLWTRKPLVFVAHSLGCHAVAWWAELSRGSPTLDYVQGALLVAPPEVDKSSIPTPLRNFAPSPDRPFPFPTTLVASRDDPYAHPRRSALLAARWGSRFVDVGRLGHINAQSGIGAWPEGEALLDELIDRSRDREASEAVRSEFHA